MERMQLIYGFWIELWEILPVCDIQFFFRIFFHSKRSCYLRLPGMDCDYGDFTGNAKDQSMWGNEDSPGKKRRSSNICYKIGNPEGCLGKVIDENQKDSSHWGNPDSPGKK